MTTRLLAVMAVTLSAVMTPAQSMASDAKTIFFHCYGNGWNYQLSFHEKPDSVGLVQRIQDLGANQIENSETPLTEYEWTDAFLSYQKQGYRFTVNREGGTVTRNGETMPVKCQESEVDLVAATQAKIDRAKTTTTEFWSPTKGHSDTEFVQLGMLATSEEICRVFDHPFFLHESEDYLALDTVNSEFDWDGIEAASLWINHIFAAKGIQLNRFYLMPNIHQAANQNLSVCLAAREKATPGFYERLTRHFLVNLNYRGINCHEPQFRVQRDVDNNGNIIERKIQLEAPDCINFDYNSGRLNNWNSSTFTLMLIWREAHPVLQKIFDQGETLLLTRLKEIERVRLAQNVAEQERQRQSQLQKAEREQRWSQYQARDKTLLEQVYNFSTTGNTDGSEHAYWTEIDKCVLSDGAKIIDNRKLNMTAFRMYREFIGSSWYVISTDSNVRLSTSANIPMDRLQKAWGLAFQECPGKKSKF